MEQDEVDSQLFVLRTFFSHKSTKGSVSPLSKDFNMLRPSDIGDNLLQRVKDLIKIVVVVSYEFVLLHDSVKDKED